MTTLTTQGAKVDQLRAQLPATRNTAYFNAGTNGPLSIAAHEAMGAAAHNELHTGRIVPGIYESHAVRNDRIRTLLAEAFHARPSEFALTRSTTEGLNIALHGLEWQRGDEIITTNLEHPGLMTPLALLAHRYGVAIRVADIGDGDGDVTGAIRAALTSRTRVVTLSHLTWSSGAVLPLKSIVELAHEAGALVIVDAAQSAGQIPLNLRDLNVDVYAISGQKWLCGPEGTGALYIR
ncbi:MAG: aminotransferase class V-fold PLP-dependent enzyme, partial [Chloroflexota bacterium]|nr:aminotransferase class V-fold PLP-dependent enzyme [Chloroflexota bacterium]